MHERHHLLRAYGWSAGAVLALPAGPPAGGDDRPDGLANEGASR
jgi:hypothetical protein